MIGIASELVTVEKQYEGLARYLLGRVLVVDHIDHAIAIARKFRHTVLEKLRNRADTRTVPVIMASAKSTEYDKVSGLDRGADDYLAKPFGMMEMVSRVRAVLRRSAAPQDDKTLRSGNIELNIGEHRVIANGIDVQLTLKEFELLRLFMENPGHVFSRESLLSRIWGEDFIGESRTVDVHIGTLRAKLGEAGDSIETVRGVGYRMGKKS